MKNATIIAGLLLALCTVSGMAMAQMNNRPFSFRGSADGGVGISLGGKQAILNEKIYDSTPTNLVRGFDGSLLDITKGPGNSAFVSVPGGNFIPSFREHSFRNNNAGISTDVFDAYVAWRSDENSRTYFVPEKSSAVVNTWTTRVISGGMPVSYSPNSTVDTWTSMVYIAH